MSFEFSTNQASCIKLEWWRFFRIYVKQCSVWL